MIFFLGETPDGWGIPGVHGPWEEDELDGYVQSGVYLIRGKGESLLVDSGNWTLPEHNNGMGEFLVELLDKEKNDLKYIFITHFHYDPVGNAAMLKKRYGAQVVCHPRDRPIIEDPMIVTRRENITRLGTTPEAMLEDFNLQPGESFGLSDPDIVRRYWNFPVEVTLAAPGPGRQILDNGRQPVDAIDAAAVAWKTELPIGLFELVLAKVHDDEHRLRGDEEGRLQRGGLVV